MKKSQLKAIIINELKIKFDEKYKHFKRDFNHSILQ